MTNYKMNIEKLIEVCKSAQLVAIKAGIEDMKSRQAFQAMNTVLLYPETGEISVMRHPGGCILGDVAAGKAIDVFNVRDWTTEDFEKSDPAEIDAQEYLYFIEDKIEDEVEAFIEQINKIPDETDSSTRKAIRKNNGKRFFNSELGRIMVMPKYWIKEIITGKVIELVLPFAVLEMESKSIIWTCQYDVEIGGHYVNQCQPGVEIEVRDINRLGGTL